MPKLCRAPSSFPPFRSPARCRISWFPSTVLHNPTSWPASLPAPLLGECLPLSSRLQSAARGHQESGWEARHLHSTSRGCSDLTCNSSDKSLSAMPMAKSVVTLFILISSAQISSSQRLAGSYRFLINVLTDFPDLGAVGDRCGVEVEVEDRKERGAGEPERGKIVDRITSGL